MALPAAADPLAYAVSFNKLYRIDLGSGQTTLIGETIGQRPGLTPRWSAMRSTS